MKKGQSIIKILPDRVFDKLWSTSSEYSRIEEFAKFYRDKLNFSLWGFDSTAANELMFNIYKANHLSMKEIFEKSGCKKSEFAHIFCINVRTLNYWIAENNCPSYVRLMFIRHFDLINLGNHVYLQSQYKPRTIYKPAKKDEVPIISKSTYQSIKKYEQEHVHYGSDARNILEKTDYLRKLLQK